MKILAIDTSMASCSAAVIGGAEGHVLASAEEAMERGHAEAIAPMVQQVLDAAGLLPCQLDRIAVTTGPGTFTGVRIGLAMARGLGLALSIPVIGIDSLLAIAANEPEGDTAILVAASARNSEAYVAVHGADLTALHAPGLVALNDVAALAPAGARVLGSAADEVMARPGATGFVRSRAGDLPSAARFGRLAIGVRAPGAMPRPLYLRAPDAKPQPGPAVAWTIAEAGTEAAALLAGLHATSFDRPWPAESFAALLATPGTTACIATRGSEPGGFLITRRAADEAEIVTVAVVPMLRRLGLARRLLTQHLGDLRLGGIGSVFLEVATSNAAARGLYAAMGFTEAGVRRNYYSHADGRREDAIVMRRTLSS